MAVAGSNTKAGSVVSPTEAKMTTVSEPKKDTVADQLWFELTASAFYHRNRLAWFSALHRGSMFLNVLFGTAAVAAVVQSSFVPPLLPPVLLALVSASGLAFDFAGRARKHEDRRRTYHDFAAKLLLCEADEAKCLSLRAAMIQAAADDPPIYKAADALAYNEAIKSLGRDPNEAFVLSYWQSLTRHVFSYTGTDFPQRKDLPH